MKRCVKKCVKKCEYCGKTFYTGSAHKKYCTNECRNQATKRKIDSKSQLCWLCGRATGKCPWSSCLRPVKGWTAEPITTKDKEGDIHTYRIKSCPLFIEG